MEEGKRRAPRTPKSPEEIAELVLLKKIREYKKLQTFKKSFIYKSCNIFNVLCFFVYIQLIICFFGPANYQLHYCKGVRVNYGFGTDKGHRIISYIKLEDVNGKEYEFVINGHVEIPKKYSGFNVGKDFILQKEIKGNIAGSEEMFRIHRAGPLLFLSIFVSILSCIFFSYNLNQNPHSLRAITLINLVTLFSFCVI